MEEDPGLLTNIFEDEFREECKARKDTDKKVREAIKTLERDLRDESVSRRTNERQIAQLSDIIETLCSRIKDLENRVEDLETAGCDDPNCRHYKRRENGSGEGDGEAGGLKANITPPTTPSLSNHHHHLHSQSQSNVPSTAPPTPPTPLSLRISASTPRLPEYMSRPQQRHSAGLVPFTGPSSPPTPMSFPSPSPLLSPLSYPSLSSSTPASPNSFYSPPPTPGGHAALRSFSSNNLQQLLDVRLTSPKQNGRETDRDDDDNTKDEGKDGSTKPRKFFRKTMAIFSPPTSPAHIDSSPKMGRKISPIKEEEKEGKEKEKEKEKDGDSRMEKSRSSQLVRSASQAFRKAGRPLSLKTSLKIDSGPSSVFGNMGVSDDTCVKVIKDIASFLKNYVHLPPADLFQEKAWSEQAILLKEAIQSGNLPDFSFKYQHDPHSVAQFLYEILASSEKGILCKVGRGLVDSVDIDLSVYTGLKHYKLSLLHSLMFLLDVDPHFALFYTLDLLRAFFKIRPEASLAFFGSKFGPVCLKEFSEKEATNVFATLLQNFSAILEAKDDIHFALKDGRQTVHAASLDRLFEKLLDPYYRDSLFVDTFFLTYDYFISPQDMLQKFTDYYWLASSGYPQNWKTQLSIRVLAVMKMWIMTHETSFRKNEDFLCLLRQFVDAVTTPFPNELAFFRYFTALAYQDEPDGQEEMPNGVVGPHCQIGDSEDSDLSWKSSDQPNSEDRTGSALTNYDEEDEFAKSELAKADSSMLRSSSEFERILSSAPNPPVISMPTRGGSLSRSISTSNIYVTKEGKIGTVQSGSGRLKQSAKGNSANNLFTVFTPSPPTSSNPSPSPSPTPPHELDGSIGTSAGSNLTINIATLGEPNGKENNEKPNTVRHGLQSPIRKTGRNRVNSDDSVLRSMVTGNMEYPPTPTLGLSPSNYTPVCNVDPEIVAMHIAVVDQSYFRLIPYTEWLHKAFLSKGQSPHFHNMVAKFNDWGRWASTEILRRERASDKATAITFFVDIIKHSVQIQNFNAAAALIGGLSHSSVSRLKPVWEKVSAKTMQEFNRMNMIFDMGKNCKNYREKVKASKPPVIPYLALCPKDLIAIEEANQTILDNGLINFHKLRLLAKLVKYVLQVQQPLYVHPQGTQDPQLNEYLRNKLGGKEGLLTEREMMNISMSIQPSAAK